MTLILAGCKEWSTEQARARADKVLFLRISKTPRTISDGEKKVCCQGQTQKMSQIWQICLCCEKKKIADSVNLRISAKFQPQNLNQTSASKS